MAQAKIEDPNPSSFNKGVIISAVVIIALGILVLIFADVIVGFIIALLGAIFGLGSQVARDNSLK